MPTLYTTREAAEEARRAIEENDPEAYLDLVERYGEDGTNRAYTNFAPLRVLWTDRESLIAALDAAAFPALLMDGEFRLRHALLGELLAEEEG